MLVKNPSMDPKLVSHSPEHTLFNPYLEVNVSNLGKAVSVERGNIWRRAERSLAADLWGHALCSFSCLC